MLEALKCLAEYKFREDAVDYFDCEYEPSNVASRGLQEKMGFCYWGEEQLGDKKLIINILRKPV